MKRIAVSMSCFLMLVTLSGVSITGTDKTQWIYLAGESEQEGFSYDPQSIMQVAPSVFRVWTKVANADSSETKTLREVDCSNKIIRDVQVTVEKNNAVISSRHLRGDVREAVRGKPSGRLFAALCRKSAPESFPDWHRQEN